MSDKAPILEASATPELKDPAKVITIQPIKPEPTSKKDEQLLSKDVKVIEHALDNISKDKKTFVVEKEVIEELKEEMADYQEDVLDLKKVVDFYVVFFSLNMCLCFRLLLMSPSHRFGNQRQPGGYSTRSIR